MPRHDPSVESQELEHQERRDERVRDDQDRAQVAQVNGHGDDVHQRQDRGRVEKSLRRLPRSPHAPHEPGERHEGEGTQHGERQQTGEEGSREVATPVPQSLEAAHEPIEAEVGVEQREPAGGDAERASCPRTGLDPHRRRTRDGAGEERQIQEEERRAGVPLGLVECRLGVRRREQHEPRQQDARRVDRRRRHPRPRVPRREPAGNAPVGGIFPSSAGGRSPHRVPWLAPQVLWIVWTDVGSVP